MSVEAFVTAFCGWTRSGEFTQADDSSSLRATTASPFIIGMVFLFILATLFSLLIGWLPSWELTALFTSQAVLVIGFFKRLITRDLVAKPSRPSAYMVGAVANTGRGFEENLHAHGFCPFPSASLSDVKNSILRNRDTCAIALVDIDEAHCLDTLVDDLIQFRRQYPEVHILLLSREFCGDDLSTERRPICDISLRKPVSPPRLNTALNELERRRLAVNSPSTK